MVCVLLDTNALLIPFEFGLDIYKQIKNLVPKAKIITLSLCVDELKSVKPRIYESIINLGLKKGLTVIETLLKAKNVDSQILDYAVSHKCIVFTQDIGLKKKLLNVGLHVVIMRQKKYLKVV